MERDDERGRRRLELVRNWINGDTRGRQDMEVYTLVGKSGSGKSFNAMEVCRAHGIDAIIDDGF